VDRDAALALLPPLHAHALRLRDDGLGDGAIAERLGLERDGIAPVLRVADAKLRRLMAEGATAAGDDDGS
jgi:DNA-directed RNA polymerase specialized sigma24 family protein